jgi:hypothetical protein
LHKVHQALGSAGGRVSLAPLVLTARILLAASRMHSPSGCARMGGHRAARGQPGPWFARRRGLQGRAPARLQRRPCGERWLGMNSCRGSAFGSAALRAVGRQVASTPSELVGGSPGRCGDGPHAAPWRCRRPSARACHDRRVPCCNWPITEATCIGVIAE